MDPDIRAISKANFAFSAKLLEQNLTPGANNLVFSPFSASLILLMARFGALGRTGSQIDQALHFPQTEDLDQLIPTRRGFTKILKSIQDSSQSPDYEVNVVSRMYTQEDLVLNEIFRNVSKRVLNIKVRQVDFYDGKNATETINNWVNSATKEKIPELFNPESFTQDTKLVMVNAIYFKSPWKYPFESRNTRNTRFYVSERKTAEVRMMHTTEKFSYKDLPELNARMVVIPYKDDHASMYVFIPNEKTGLDNLVRDLKRTTMDRIKENMVVPGNCEEVKLALPKFKIESTLSLVEPLRNLGAIDMFSKTDANFRGITKGTELYVSEILQKAFIQVDEEGTEAAAAAGIQAGVSCIPTTTQIKADRPFYYQIVDHKTDVVLFAGTVRNPNA